MNNQVVIKAEKTAETFLVDRMSNIILKLHKFFRLGSQSNEKFKSFSKLGNLSAKSSKFSGHNE